MFAYKQYAYKKSPSNEIDIDWRLNTLSLSHNSQHEEICKNII